MNITNQNQNQQQSEDDDYEWDDSKATLTAWSLTMGSNKQRGKRAYGRRSSSLTNIQLPAIPSGNSSTSLNTNNIPSTSNNIPSKTYGRKKTMKHKRRDTWTKSSGESNVMDKNHKNNASESSSLSSTSLTSATTLPSTTQSHSQRSMSLSSFNEICFQSINEENLHPNVYGNNFQSSQTFENGHGNGNGNSANDSLSFSINSGACFSSLHRGSLSTSYSGFDHDSNNDSGFIVPCLTPSRSVSSSSRKRGVCDSPLIHCDDASSTASGGLSVSNTHLSTSSNYSRRARSRIFSPESTKKLMALEKIMALEAVASADGDDNADHITSSNSDIDVVKMKGKKDMMSIRKKDESFHESESEMEADDNDNDNSFSFHNTSCELSQADLEEFQRNESFTEIGTRPIGRKKKQLLPRPLPLPLLPRRMSSASNIPFEEAIFSPVESVTKKKSEYGNGGVIFDTMSSYEDLKFLLKDLRRWFGGKLVASFGVSNNCTVVPPNAWSSSRRAAFVHWSITHLGFSHRCCGGGVNVLQISISKGKQLQKDLEQALLQYKEASRKNKLKIVGTDKKKKKAHMTLHETPIPMSTIKISRIAYTPMSIEKNSASHGDDCDNSVDELAGDLKLLNIKQSLSTINYDNESIDCGTTPLARMVTLPDDMNYSAISKPARLSYDNSIMDARDFVSHMHGYSPQVHHNNIIRPPALTLPRRKFAETNTTVQNISPAIPNITAALSFDQIETPGVHKLNKRWGSRPIDGKDWGQSDECKDTVIDILLGRLDEACACVGSVIVDQINSTTSCFVRPGMSGVKADSRSLGFESEADNSSALQLPIYTNNLDIETETHPLSEKKDNDSTLLGARNLTKEDLLPPINPGASSFTQPNMKEDIMTPEKVHKRRVQSFAKRSRMSICNSAMESRTKPLRASVFQTKTSFAYEVDPYPCRSSIVGLSPMKPKQGKSTPHQNSMKLVLTDTSKLFPILSFLSENELQCTASLVCSTWADAATDALASLMLISVGCTVDNDNDDEVYDDMSDDNEILSLHDEDIQPCSISMSMQRSWEYITARFPWGAFLSEGSFKRVYRVWNSAVEAEEAVSVMDVNKIDDKNIVGNELAVSVMLSSLARRHVCPNFVKMRGVFTADYEPPTTLWGCSENKKPHGSSYTPHSSCAQRIIHDEPAVDKRGLFQYIRMELCQHGDVEEFIKKQPNLCIPPDEGRCLLFQMAYSLHVAGDRFGLKHYDVKLLNFFLQAANNESNVVEEENPYTVLRYGLGSHVFNLKMATSRALIAKLADFGTANTRPESNGQPVMLNNFTTLENTPPDFMILGDAALQGYGHDCFGLGLCMLHLFTGNAPYEEILESVKCPLNFKKKLKKVWEGKRSSSGYTVIRSVITLDVWEDEYGNIEGQPDETLYDTLYRYLVLFGIPEHKFQFKEGCKVWDAISSCLETANEKSPNKIRRSRRNNNNEIRGNKNVGLDVAQFQADCELFSLLHGKNMHITRARDNLESMDGGIDLLLSLVSFDPNKRASALDVMNSTFMAALREDSMNLAVQENDKVYSYMSYSVGIK